MYGSICHCTEQKYINAFHSREAKQRDADARDCRHTEDPAFALGKKNNSKYEGRWGIKTSYTICLQGHNMRLHTQTQKTNKLA